MVASYRTPHPNYLHLLFVTPSKHLHALKDGRIKWQHKPMEVKLREISSSEREHVVYFLLADHCSSAFYAEAHSCRQLPTAKDFLLRAWRRKEDHFFHGLPLMTVVPKTVERMEPDIRTFIESYGVTPAPAESGFKAGVHQIRTLENSLANSISWDTDATIADVGKFTAEAMLRLNDSPLSRTLETRRAMWERGVMTPGVLLTI